MGAFNQSKQFILTAIVLLLSVLPGLKCSCNAQQASGQPTQEPVQQPTQQRPSQQFVFPIEGFLVEGNTLLSPETVQDALEFMIGPGKNASDVEAARDTLEKLYHSKGYPTVLVGIPEQSVQEGIIRLEVVESRIAKVTTSGNRFVTAEKLRRSLPSIKSGEILYTPQVQAEFTKVNENPDMKVTPSLAQGSEPGTVDVDLKVDDKLPLHASLELNNRSSPNTTDLRLNAVVHYDNLWQREHSLSLQYQNSPEDPNEVEVGAIAYSLPAPWNLNHLILLSGIISDSNTASGEGFNVVGKGHQVGLRYIVPLPGLTNYSHNFIAGLDYKDFSNLPVDEPKSKNSGTPPPVTYFPLSFAYSSYLMDPHGVTQFTTGVNMAFRGLISDEKAFAGNRYDAQGNYLYGTACVERTQDLVAGSKLRIKADGQVSDSPLINNEQYAGGGIENVRGYRETEALGDCAGHCTIELLAPELAGSLHVGDAKLKCTPFVFNDYAHLFIEDALPKQRESFDLDGTGVGVKGIYDKRFEYETCWASALCSTAHTKAGDSRVHFRVKYLY